MIRDTTIIHLANVLTIAEADGTLSEKEYGALCEVMLRIGADENDLDAARDRLEREPPYRLQPLSNAADNMKMVENMVLVALADGHVSPYESQPLEAFLSSLGFVQADMDMIVKRVRVRLRTIPPMPLLPPPPTNRRPDAMRANGKGGHVDRVVPAIASRQTGKKVTPKLPPLPPPPRRTVQPQPPAQAQAAPTAAPVPPEPAHEAVTTPRDVQAPTPVEQCAHRREASPAGSCYCFGCPEEPLNPWGCRLIDMPWSNDAPWFRLGHFRDNDTFVFDHEALSDCLRRRLSTVANCPFLLPGFAEAALETMPLRATTTGRWRHHLASQTLLAASAMPVTIRTYRHGCGQHAVARSDGLSPTDDRDARLMIRRTVRQRRAPVDLTVLDKRQGGKS